MTPNEIKALTDEAIDKTQVITYKFVLSLLDKFSVALVKATLEEELKKVEDKING